MQVFIGRVGERVVLAPGLSVTVTGIRGNEFELTMDAQAGWGRHAAPSKPHLKSADPSLEDTVRATSERESPYFAECP